MSKGNKTAKEALIKKYGAKCFIEELHLREDDTPRVYTGKAQYQRMKQLTYHHIKMKKDGGKATVENGALLRNENHMWFHKQPKDKQAKMNQAFQDYKLRFAKIEVKDNKLEVEPIEMPECEEYIEIPVMGMEEITLEEYIEYKKHKEERNRKVYKKMGYDYDER